MNKDWLSIDLAQVDTPALIVDQDSVQYNIELALQYAGGIDKLRPHVKTHKMLEVAKMQIAAGIYKFKCATIAEAEMLGMAGAKNVLIAYPVQGPKIDRVLQLIKKFPETTYSILVDNYRTATIVDKKALEAGTILGVYVDVNNGQDRTGLKIESIEALAEKLQSLKNIVFLGLHCYDGHIRIPDFEQRSARCRQAFDPVLELREKLKNSLQIEVSIVAGGTPTFRIHAKHHEVECSPGTFIFWDERYARQFEEQVFQKAAVVATRIISKINSYTYCTDLGHKSIASENPFPRVAFLNETPIEQIGHSEEHLIIKTESPDVFQEGDLLLAYPLHICPTVALYEKAIIIRQGQIIDHWEVTARNRKITI